MGRKPVLEGGKRDEIINAALELFFANGYEGTSVRAIQKKVGSEIGLFYYYFKSKDEVFDIAINRYMEKYHALYQDFIEKNKDKPEKLLINFFEAVKNEVFDFRNANADKLHWSVRRAIREQGLEILCPYVEECLGLMMEAGIVLPDISFKTLSVVLSYGVGGTIIQHKEELSNEEMELILNSLI